MIFYIHATFLYILRSLGL